MHYELKYQDRIYIEDDEGNLELFWQNEPRNSRWYSDNNEDSEYNKMMELHAKWNFVDYDNPELPNFQHYVMEMKYKVTKKKTEWVAERCVGGSSLVEEYFNT